VSNLEDKIVQNMGENPAIFGKLLLNNSIEIQSSVFSSDKTEIICISHENLLKTVDFLKHHIETRFDILFSVTASDKFEFFEVIYHLYSSILKHKVIVKTILDKINPEIHSLTGFYQAADWHERETYDLLGIKFLNHPDLRRILLPDDWKGYPLRKNYIMNDERLIWNRR